MSFEQTAGQVEQKTQPSTRGTIAHSDQVERNGTESRENLDIYANTADLQQENANTENSKKTSGPSATKPIIALKRIIKQQHIWGYHEDTVFIKLDPPDLLEKCPSCGAGPIKWSAIRNKRNNAAVGRLRCNRQAKGTCDYRGAVRRTERKRMMRAAANVSKSRLSQPIDQACNFLKDAVRLLEFSDKTTLFTYLSRNEVPTRIRAFMMQFLETPVESMPDMMAPQLYLGSSPSTLNPSSTNPSSLSAFTAPFTSQSSSLSTAPFKAKPPSLPAPFQQDSSSLSTMLAPKAPHTTPLTSTQSTALSSMQKEQTRDLASTLTSQPNNLLASNLSSSTDPLATFGTARIGRFSASMAGFLGADAQTPDVTSGISLGSGWNSSLDFKPLSLDTATGTDTSLTNAINNQPNSLNRLALGATLKTTKVSPRNRKRDLNGKFGNAPSKKGGFGDSLLDPPCTLPRTTTKPPALTTDKNIPAIDQSSAFNHMLGQNEMDSANMATCPCCLNSVSPSERFCLVCGACLQWT